MSKQFSKEKTHIRHHSNLTLFAYSCKFDIVNGAARTGFLLPVKTLNNKVELDWDVSG